MEWALNQIYCQNHDRNPHRFARVNALVQYGMDVAFARRSKSPMPPRPNIDEII